MQKILRHSNPALTSEIYGHLDMTDMRAGINRLSFGLAVAESVEPQLVACGDGGSVSAPLVTNLLQDDDLAQTKTPDRIELPSESGAEFGAEHRVRTGDLRLGKGGRASPVGIYVSQNLSFPSEKQDSAVQASQALSAEIKPFATQFATQFATRFATASAATTGLRLVIGARDNLLRVRDVAARLGVSTATVYALCEKGEIEHCRIRNAIRFRPVAVEAYVERCRATK